MMGSSSSSATKQGVSFDEIQSFKFHENFIVDTNNGLCFNGVYLPEEIVNIILNYVDVKEILNITLVCKKWCNIIKSTSFWMHKYCQKYPDKPHKKLPWYVYYAYFSTNYFDRNLLKNGNGQNGFKHWKIITNYGDEFRIENPPAGADPLPAGVPDFNGHTGCFATSFYECNKLQLISFQNNKLLQLIFYLYKPHIYISEWVAGRFDCGCVYKLWCLLCGHSTPNDKAFVESFQASDRPNTPREKPSVAPNRAEQRENRHNPAFEYFFDELNPAAEMENASIVLANEFSMNLLALRLARHCVQQWQGGSWSKVEFLVKDYPGAVDTIIFQHEGKDAQFWKGHYGSKMAGGVVKILFDSIEEK